MAAIYLDLETFAIDDAAQYIEPVEAPANYKDPVKIAEYVQTAQARAVDRCALDPDLTRIVCFGCAVGNETVVTALCRNQDEERDTLRRFWDLYRNQRAGVLDPMRGVPIVTFNGLRYDLPVLIRRSQYLGVPTPVISLDKYRSPHLDLLNELTFKGAIQGHQLRFYLSRFGIPHDDLVSGKDIAGLVKAGQWEEVAAHCKADVEGVRALAQRIGVAA